MNGQVIKTILREATNALLDIQLGDAPIEYHDDIKNCEEYVELDKAFLNKDCFEYQHTPTKRSLCKLKLWKSEDGVKVKIGIVYTKVGAYNSSRFKIFYRFV